MLRHHPLCLALHSNLLDHETKKSKPLEIGFLSANKTFETFSGQKSLYQLKRPVVGGKDWVRELLKNGSGEHLMSSLYSKTRCRAIPNDRGLQMVP
ncbi:hypothetical protein TNCV_2635931 [Trichonephila clavipes]|nr:hypothetical protein TNCV_2635931 [Trichonephila clavipes]